MPNGLSNWCYRDVIDFLKENDFEFSNQKNGSHEAWVNLKTQAIVDIDFHGPKSFPIRTLETMIRQSKLNKKVWRDWASR